MSTHAIELRRADDNFVPGLLHDELVPAHLILVEAQWQGPRIELGQELRRLGVPLDRWPQSLHWDWAKKAYDLNLLEAGGYAIEGDGEWQAVMLTKAATHVSEHAPTRGMPLVYVDYLEVAPWNWTVEDIGRRPRYKALGTTLLGEAVLQSVRDEFDGRVGLHSLQQAEPFYQHCGMMALGKDPTKEHLMYFEFTVEQAQRFLHGR